MSSTQLPPRPDLDHLKRRAKELLKAYLRGDPEARRRVHAVPELQDVATLRLTQAQWVLARELGFASWPRLKAHIELAGRSFADRCALFLESVCLVSAQRRGDLRRAREVLTHDPAVAQADIFCACAAGDRPTVERLLARTPTLAATAGGVRQWPPLLYLCFSGLLRGDAARTAEMLAIARRLLACGADPSAHFQALGHDPGYHESALSGACEVGQNPDLMRLLIEAGARVEGDQSAYSAVGMTDLRCLEVLIEHGLPASQLSLGHQLDHEDPAGVRRLLELGVDCKGVGASGETALHWAIKRNRSLDILTLLIDHGADVNAIIPAGRTVFPTLLGSTPLDLAIRTLNAPAVDLLLARGAHPKRYDTLERLLLACARADRAAMQAVLSTNPDLVRSVPEEDLRALPRAAARGDAGAVELLLEAGFDTAIGDWMGGTALHQAAMAGQLRTVEVLIAGGADLSDRRNDHRSTPLHWAQWGSANDYQPGADYVGVIERLIAAGAELPTVCEGSEAVQALLHRYGVPDDEDEA